MPVSKDEREKDVDYSFAYARRRDPTCTDPTVRYTKEAPRVFLPRLERFEPGDRVRIKQDSSPLILGDTTLCAGEECTYIEPSIKFPDRAIIRYKGNRAYALLSNLTKKGVLG